MPPLFRFGRLLATAVAVGTLILGGVSAAGYAVGTIGEHLIGRITQ